QRVQADSIEGTLQTLVIPSEIKNARMEAVLHAKQIRLSGDFPLNIANLQATLRANTLEQILFTIQSDPIEASLSGAWKPKTSEFVLNKPFTLKYAVDGPSLKAMFPTAPLLAKPAAIQLSIDPLPIPLSTARWKGVALKGKLSSSEVVLGSQSQRVTLQNISIPFQWNSGSKTATLQLSSQMKNPSGSAGSVEGQCTLSNFILEKGIDFSQASLFGTLDLDNLSSGLLDAFYQDASLSAIIGPVFSNKLKFQSTLEKQNIAIKWTSANLNVDSSFLIDSSGLQLQGAMHQLSWVLTPESYKALDQIITAPKALAFKAALLREIQLVSSKKKNQTKKSPPLPSTLPKPQPSPFEISEPSTFLISLSKLSLPGVPKPGSRIPDIVFDLTKLQLNATARNSKLSFFDKTSKETIQLSNIVFSLNKTADKGPLTASFDSGVITHSGSAAAPEFVKNGSISLEGKLLQSSSNTAFDLSQLICSLQMKVQQLPSRALDIIARARGRTDFPFSTTFGEMINATTTLDVKNLSGPFSINLNTPRARLDLEGNLANGAVLLKNTLHAQLKLTPELSRLILKEVNPLNLSHFYSRDPITLEIPAAGFYLPLYPFNASK